MGVIDKKTALGAALAIGAVLLVPGVAAALARAARPVVKSAVKTGVMAYKEVTHAGAELYEHVEDVVAEVENEIDGDQSKASEDVVVEFERAARHT